MDEGNFCFLSDQYYIDFPDDKLMKNKKMVNGIFHNRPCFFVFRDPENCEILWLVPISSKYEKYKRIYDKKIAKYGKCNTIRFGKVLNKDAAFLIQNMCPVIGKYIEEIYVDKNDVPIVIDKRIVHDVTNNAKEVLAIQKRGIILIFPDVAKIEASLIQQLAEQEKSKSGLLPRRVSIIEHIDKNKYGIEHKKKKLLTDLHKNLPSEREI